MSIHVKIEMARICLNIGNDHSYWYGPASIDVQEPSIRHADPFPFLPAPEQSVQIYKRSNKPPETILMDGRVGAYLNRANKKGYDSYQTKDIVCVSTRSKPDQNGSWLAISIILSPEKFDLMDEHLRRLQTKSAVCIFSCGFLGMRGDGFDEDVFPTQSEFVSGHPYIVGDDLEFSFNPVQP